VETGQRFGGLAELVSKLDPVQELRRPGWSIHGVCRLNAAESTALEGENSWIIMTPRKTPGVAASGNVVPPSPNKVLPSMCQENGSDVSKIQQLHLARRNVSPGWMAIRTACQGCLVVINWGKIPARSESSRPHIL
jgi:hypothetical protein